MGGRQVRPRILARFAEFISDVEPAFYIAVYSPINSVFSLHLTFVVCLPMRKCSTFNRKAEAIKAQRWDGNEVTDYILAVQSSAINDINFVNINKLLVLITRV
ncbi:hypothetical protein AVEN_3403-1 [Araneus ventricosus]|uniref:Uncharacterized protein n=1 Tax=Araneus ventricosus TaxID=182803 RepID=A0A4Y2WEM9_ARAVE|nr:hypothetical protein AVEN_3403-1 [Araneus ventricosus]